MEVKPGYKQTEVGVIPEEWEVKPLGEIGGVRMCKRVLKNQTREHGDVPFYKIGTFGGVADAFIPQSLFDEFLRKYSFPRKGDILISAAGTIGRTVSYDGAPAYFQDSNIVWIDNDESKATNAYLWHRYQVTKWSVSHGGTVARLYNDNLRTKIYIAVPSLPEQHAIAEALSDVDGLLGGLDRLIAKKRDLKQAAMQQLLTGQTRLPGFHGEWKPWTILQIAPHIIDYRGRTPLKLGMEWGGGDIPALSARNVRMGFIDFHEETYFGSDGLYSRWMTNGHTRKGDLVITTEAPLGNVALIPDDRKYILSQRTILLQVDPSIASNRFLLQLMMGSRFQQVLAENSSGSTATGIQRKRFEKLELTLPEVPEQTAIAEVLTEMDAELAALEQRREKTRALKEAMMQELLTGRTRLVEPSSLRSAAPRRGQSMVDGKE